MLTLDQLIADSCDQNPHAQRLFKRARLVVLTPMQHLSPDLMDPSPKEHGFGRATSRQRRLMGDHKNSNYD